MCAIYGSFESYYFSEKFDKTVLTKSYIIKFEWFINYTFSSALMGISTGNFLLTEVESIN